MINESLWSKQLLNRVSLSRWCKLNTVSLLRLTKCPDYLYYVLLTVTLEAPLLHVTLLGMSLKSQIYINTILPFGLRSAPLIFTAVADAIQWIMEVQGVKHVMHYLDDYLTLGPPDSPEYQRSLERTLSCCKRLGIPIAQHKTEGPSTQLVFLGIELNTRDSILRLYTRDKAAEITKRD